MEKKWIWMMDYCKKRGISPAENWAWKQAKEAYCKLIKKEKKNG